MPPVLPVHGSLKAWHSVNAGLHAMAQHPCFSVLAFGQGATVAVSARKLLGSSSKKKKITQKITLEAKSLKSKQHLRHILLSSSAQAAITKYHTLVTWKFVFCTNKHGGWKFRIKVLRGCFSWGFSPWLAYGHLLAVSSERFVTSCVCAMSLVSLSPLMKAVLLN